MRADVVEGRWGIDRVISSQPTMPLVNVSTSSQAKDRQEISSCNPPNVSPNNRAAAAAPAVASKSGPAARRSRSAVWRKIIRKHAYVALVVRPNSTPATGCRALP